MIPLEGLSSLKNSMISFILAYQLFAVRSLLMRGWRSLFPPRLCLLAHPCFPLSNPKLPFSKLTAQSWTSRKPCPCQEKLREHSVCMVGSSFMDIQVFAIGLFCFGCCKSTRPLTNSQSIPTFLSQELLYSQAAAPKALYPGALYP